MSVTIQFTVENCVEILSWLVDNAGDLDIDYQISNFKQAVEFEFINDHVATLFALKFSEYLI